MQEETFKALRNKTGIQHSCGHTVQNIRDMNKSRVKWESMVETGRRGKKKAEKERQYLVLLREKKKNQCCTFVSNNKQIGGFSKSWPYFLRQTS